MSICLRACLTMNKARISLGPLLLSVLHGLENLEKALKDFAVVLKEQKGSMILVCGRSFGTIGRKIAVTERTQVEFPVEQPHGRLSIENGSSMVAENAGRLLRKVGH